MCERNEILVDSPIPVEKLSEEHLQFYKDMGYIHAVKRGEEVVGLMPFIYTVGIVCGLDEYGYTHRFCYHSPLEATVALALWLSVDDDEPQNYIKRKG